MLTAIISIFIGNFLIGLLFKPALEHLRDVREELCSVRFPTRNPFELVAALGLGDRAREDDQLQREQESARRVLNEIIRKYRLAYTFFRQVGLVFLGAFLVLANVTVWTLRLKCPWSIVCYVGTSVVVILIVLFFAEEAYPSPSELLTLDHFLNHFSNIHPDVLIDLMEIGVQKVKEQGKAPYFALSTALHLTGYKVLAALTNQDQSRCFWISLGKVNKGTDVTHVVDPHFYRWYIKLGEINAGWPTGLELPAVLHLFVFMPVPAGWKSAPISPFYVSSDIWVKLGNEPAENQGVEHCHSSLQDKLIRFERKKGRFREKWKITSINSDKGASGYRLREIVRQYKRMLERARTISTFSDSELPPPSS